MEDAICCNSQYESCSFNWLLAASRLKLVMWDSAPYEGTNKDSTTRTEYQILYPAPAMSTSPNAHAIAKYAWFPFLVTEILSPPVFLNNAIKS